jgi:hypothetical protein
MKDWLGSDRLDEAVEIPKAMRPKKMRRLFHSARDSRFDGEKTPVKTTVTNTQCERRVRQEKSERTTGVLISLPY